MDGNEIFREEIEWLDRAAAELLLIVVNHATIMLKGNEAGLTDLSVSDARQLVERASDVLAAVVRVATVRESALVVKMIVGATGTVESRSDLVERLRTHGHTGTL